MGWNPLSHIRRLWTPKDDRVPQRHMSFSQAGEDAILRFFFDTIERPTPMYLEIGAYHPVEMSNTYLFYLRGGCGVCVDPLAETARLFEELRPLDVFVEAGVGAESGEYDLFVMEPASLSTFSRDEADRYLQEFQYSLAETRRVPVLTVNQILEAHFTSAPDLVSLDVEGLDLEIVESLDISRWRPAAICAETSTYSADTMTPRDNRMTEMLVREGYMVFADTQINTIYVDEEVWRSRRVRNSRSIVGSGLPVDPN